MLNLKTVSYRWFVFVTLIVEKHAPKTKDFLFNGGLAGELAGV